MSTTIVPQPGPLDPNVTLEALLSEVHAIHLEGQGDLDKTTDPNDAAYYAGQVDTANTIKALLTLRTDDDSEQVRADEKTEVVVPTGEQARIVADYQMMGDGEGKVWMTDVLNHAKTQGDITGFEVTGSYLGQWGLQYITFSVDVLLVKGGKFAPDHTHPEIAAEAVDFLNEIVGDSDVQVRWTALVP